MMFGPGAGEGRGTVIGDGHEITWGDDAEISRQEV